MTQEMLRPFYAMEILARAKALEAQGRTVRHLEIGEPGASPAPGVLGAVRAGLDIRSGYTAAKGDPLLRARLSARYRERHGVDIDPDRIIVTMGSSSGFILTFLSAFQPGARIAVTRPGYPAYLNTLAALNFSAVELPLSAANGWVLTPEAIEATWQECPFEGLLLASPANPTGAALDSEALAAIMACCSRLGVRFISDEIYHGLNHTGPDASALEAGDEAIVVNSFSKYYCMTGWRIGWLVMPEDIVRRAEIMAQSLFISASSISQRAALAALDESAYYEARKAEYSENRAILAAGLERLGFGDTRPADGAFYAYVNASAFTNDTMDFCISMLELAGVASTPGADFDRIDGHKFVRFSYAGTRADIEDALDRMDAFLGRG
ncbi:pyridoxal phosphate-dependent aminotransferase [Pelagibacterium montanilacus]|uniref:pyridoxal phosphate-dependent aminotransferase n=1 Tax=Pelagibacterium montanilacus TaxID=2185280 RepID=UPI000F8DE9EF|nr:aminotransferase class I/II-fold pyridoxal phosphate-dependent enzyme [Pelagibacterium montanilacus]